MPGSRCIGHPRPCSQLRRQPWKAPPTTDIRPFGTCRPRTATWLQVAIFCRPTSPRGQQATGVGTSPWAAVITSPPVTGALVAEFAGRARQLAVWTARLASSGSPYAGLLAVAYRALHITSRWLHTAGVSAQRAQRHHPTPWHAHRLLNAIPANIPPSRRPPREAETIAELCAGIAITAERLRRITQAFATHARSSPAANSTSWRRDALASAITSHTSELILRALAERALQLGADPAVCRKLATATDASAQACAAWRAVTRHWDVISTGTAPKAISPVAAELNDLVLRTGRLAYRNPTWTPRSADASGTRDPADLAGTSTDLTAGLEITNPEMLIRAAAVDETARELLAHAATNSRHRNAVDQPSPQCLPRATSQAVRTAANDLTGRPPSRPGSSRPCATEAKRSRPVMNEPAQPRARNTMTKA